NRCPGMFVPPAGVVHRSPSADPRAFRASPANSGSFEMLYLFGFMALSDATSLRLEMLQADPDVGAGGRAVLPARGLAACAFAGPAVRGGMREARRRGRYRAIAAVRPP